MREEEDREEEDEEEEDVVFYNFSVMAGFWMHQVQYQSFV